MRHQFPEKHFSQLIVPALTQVTGPTPFNYFAADSFYYLTIAHNSSRAKFYTFDQHFPTNGFHPLWQYYLTCTFRLFNINNTEHEILLAFYSSLVFVWIGTVLTALALFSLTRSITLTLIGLVPGIYYYLFSQIDQQYFSQWSFVNGMESPLSILLFGIVFYFLIVRKSLCHPTRRNLIIVSIFLSLVTLSRLDDIFTNTIPY